MEIKTSTQICNQDDETLYCTKDKKWVRVDDVIKRLDERISIYNIMLQNDFIEKTPAIIRVNELTLLKLELSAGDKNG